MPFKSKAQWKWMFAAEERGEVPKGTARRWAHETSKSYKKLPPRKGGKKKTEKKAGLDILAAIEKLDAAYRWQRLREKRAAAIRAMPDKEFIVYIAGAMNRRYMEKRATSSIWKAIARELGIGAKKILEREASQLGEDAAKVVSREADEVARAVKREGGEAKWLIRLIEKKQNPIEPNNVGGVSSPSPSPSPSPPPSSAQVPPAPTPASAPTPGGQVGRVKKYQTPERFLHGSFDDDPARLAEAAPANLGTRLTRDAERVVGSAVKRRLQETAPDILNYSPRDTALMQSIKGGIRRVFGVGFWSPERKVRFVAQKFHEYVNADTALNKQYREFLNKFSEHVEKIRVASNQLASAKTPADRTAAAAEIKTIMASLDNLMKTEGAPLLGAIKQFTDNLNLTAYERGKIYRALVDNLMHPAQSLNESLRNQLRRNWFQFGARIILPMEVGTLAYSPSPEVVEFKRGFSSGLADSSTQETSKPQPKPQPQPQPQPQSQPQSQPQPQPQPQPKPQPQQASQQVDREEFIKDILRNIILYGGSGALAAALLSKLVGADPVLGAQVGGLAGAGLGFGGRYFNFAPDLHNLVNKALSQQT
ncbi:MAG: hypothetical protein KatS3mg087_0130 [Patescibacteria group bacterium]|nr:MAG: hypothetical protein KatS3mg087_0130 [Patescibacteria group bacterium]